MLLQLGKPTSGQNRSDCVRFLPFLPYQNAAVHFIPSPPLQMYSRGQKYYDATHFFGKPRRRHVSNYPKNLKIDSFVKPVLRFILVYKSLTCLMKKANNGRTENDGSLLAWTKVLRRFRFEVFWRDFSPISKDV